MKFECPKTILIDLQRDVKWVLEDAGYNVSVGTFGNPYVLEFAGFRPLAETSHLAGLAESEVVVADLSEPEATRAPDLAGNVHDLAWWAKPVHNIVDPRPLTMNTSRPFLDRVVKHGGLVILFSAPKEKREFVWGRMTGSGLRHASEINSPDNWSLLTILSHLQTTTDPGERVTVTGDNNPLHQILSDFRSGVFFNCTLAPDADLRPFWSPLAVNKYGRSVAGMISPEKAKGRIVVLPQVRNQPQFIRALFENALPELCPHLFPDHVGGVWVHQPEYELSRVLDLQKEITAVEESARQRRAELEAEIEAERERMGYLHQLLQGTGESLVHAVKASFETLGFLSIVDSDQQIKPGERRREDLRIEDRSPVLLIEAKGIAGMPPEHEALQVWKYIAPRMAEWNRTDVRGLSIINHQLRLPALDRNQSPFSEDVLTNACEHQVGVMTSWDFYRLVRNFLRLGWRPDEVQPLFYKSGRIEPVPVHYEYAGIIEHYYPKAGAISVNLDCTNLHIGDRIAFELPIDFIEHDIDSLEVGGQKIEEAISPVSAGVRTPLAADQARKGTRIFKVRRPSY